MSTVHISSDCTSVPLNTVKSKPKRAYKRHTKKSKSKSNNQHVSPKTGPAIPDDDVIIVGTSTKTKHQTTKWQEPKQRTSSLNKPAKNEIAPGTRKSYAEAIKKRGKVKNDAKTEQGVPAQNSTYSPNERATADENSSTKRRTRRFVRCSDRNAWKKAKKRTKQIARGKKTVLNLSDRRLSDDDFILLGKGLSFCPKTKRHDKIKLAEELFKYTRRMRLKEFFFFFEPDKNKDNYSQLPFFNRKQSSFTPPNGRDVYLDFYIEAISQEILHSDFNGKRHSNISKSEFASLRSLSRDDSIVIKRADKSGTIVIMKKSDYIAEVERQLHNSNYYEKLESDPSEEVKSKIVNCIDELSEETPYISDLFDVFLSEIRTPQFYILFKTHKERDESLPIGYPGRPIVSACNSSTDNISKYVDYVLKPLMQSLPSYVKDTTDFIQKLKSSKLAHANSYLVTLDVSSLYTNIPHKDGLDACRGFLNNTSALNELPVNSVLKLIQLVLENNHFRFN